MKKHSLALAIGLASSMLLSACGGSSSNDSSKDNQQTKQVVRGTIDGFGSVIVNGVRYNTDSADFKVKEQAGEQSMLRVGQVVTLLANGTNATHVIYDLSLEGPISSVDGNGGFTVLGQTVITNNLTIFEDITAAGLLAGTRVEVSGYIDANGNLVASFVEKDDDTDNKVELRGTVSNFDASAKTFKLRGQDISFANVSEWDLEGATLANGLNVEVEGTLSGSVLNASSIEADDEDFDEGTELKVAGLISGLDLNSKTLVVNGVKVQFSAQTELDDFALSALADGLTIEVEGKLNAQGVLVAEEMDLADEAKIELEATINGITAGADNFSGTLDVLGVSIKVDMRTRVRDDNSHNAMFNFSNLRAGDKVELTLVKEGTGYRALKLERDNEYKTQVKIEVPASEINLSNSTVLGIQFSLSGVSLPSILDANAKVELEGTVNGALSITKVEIETDD